MQGCYLGSGFIVVNSGHSVILFGGHQLDFGGSLAHSFGGDASGLASNSTITPEPEAVLAPRSVQKGGELVNQVLVQWKDEGLEEATWEEEFNIKSQFPDLRLEDKSLFEGVIDRNGSVGLEVRERPKIWRVNARRNKSEKRKDEVARE